MKKKNILWNVTVVLREKPNSELFYIKHKLTDLISQKSYNIISLSTYK
jgi:hypothetical protein